MLSVCPTFLCNEDCYYCYLGKRRQNVVLPLDTLEKRITEIKDSQLEIEAVNIFGGEITLLPPTYLNNLYFLLSSLHVEISQTSNLYNTKHLLPVALNISFQPERPDYKRIKAKLETYYTFCRNFNLLVVVLPGMDTIDIRQRLLDLDIEGCSSVTFLQYYPSIHFKDNRHIDFSDFMIRVLEEYARLDVRYTIGNILELESAYNNAYNSSLSQSLFILPNGNYGTTAYTADGYEYFKNLNTLDEFNHAIIQEKVCDCPYYGKCLAEHITPDCRGNIKLLNWYSLNRQYLKEKKNDFKNY